jgi:hypothetical protein
MGKPDRSWGKLDCSWRKHQHGEARKKLGKTGLQVEKLYINMRKPRRRWGKLICSWRKPDIYMGKPDKSWGKLNCSRRKLDINIWTQREAGEN